MKKIVLAVITASIMAACNDKQQENTEVETIETDYSLIGKKASITYPDLKVEAYYLNDSTLRWTVTDENGQTNTDDERVFYKKISEHQYFLNWIEKTGLTISQIIDTKSGVVKTFASHDDDKSERGKRSGSLVEGIIVLSDN